MKKQIRLLIENLFDDIYDLNNNDVNDVIDLGNELNKFNYKYHPKSFNELKRLLKKLLKERGKDADLNDIDVSKITIFRNYKKYYIGGGIFDGLDPHNIDISLWDVSNAKDMAFMFMGCENFNCDLSNWDVSNVEDMGGMFDGCINFDGDLSGWNVSNVECMKQMFYRCEIFTGQGLENWKPIKCTNMEQMFFKCYNFDCNLSGWDVSTVEYMGSMFQFCEIFTGQGLENWEVSNVEDMKYMFDDCISLKNTPSWYKNK